MSQSYVYVRGKVKFFKPNVPDTFQMPDGKVSRSWSHILYPDPESLEKIRELQAEGMKNVLKKDEDGYYIRFRRPCDIKLRTGQMMSLGNPEILDKDNKKLPANYGVGNGSDVTTKLEVYQHATPGGGRAKAARWASSRIEELVPFEMETDGTDDQKRLVKGLTEEPAIPW